MLYRLQNNVFIISLLAVGFMACWLYVRAFDLMATGTMLALVSQMSLLLYFAKEGRTTYSAKTLFLVVLIYSLLLGTVLMFISYVYDGDTFMLTKNDAMIYYTVSMRASSVGFLPNINYIVKNFEFEDWGSLMYDSFLMSIIPDKLFLNFTYMIAGAISSVLLYRIGRNYMPEPYAYLGGLAYGTSSFLILFHCTFLKESLFVTIVIATMYFMNRMIRKESNFDIFGFLFFDSLLFFFRPAVAAFVIMSYSVYFAIKQRGSALSLFIYLAIAVGFLISLKYMTEMADRYTAGADDKLKVSGNADAYSGGFNTFVNIFGGFFGPFPTIFTKENSVPATLQFYASGLIYKLFLILPFFTGLFFIVKNKVTDLFPIMTFLLVEMLATGIVVASLDLRKVMPHIPFTYLVSFYGLSKWEPEGVYKKVPEVAIYALAIGILILWNVVKTT